MKKSKCFINLIIGSLLIILHLTSLVGCTSGVPSDAELQSAYRNAIADARVAEPDEIYCNLEAIVYYNPDLTWEGQPGASRVLMVTWTGWDGYNGTDGETIATTRDTWVAVPEELKDFFKQNRSPGGDNLILRLEQLYGLPPHNGKKWFIEMWVNPDDIFRPSPDPEIADHEAELEFPKWVDTYYREWFNKQKESSYGESGYPWTRLGYTYDWGNPKSEIGLSEFVIRSGSSIKINSVSSTLDYSKN